jgi:hypothetical protein
MAMSRALLVTLGLVLSTLVALTSCTAPSSSAASAAAAPALRDAPRRAGMDAVLVFLPLSSHTREAWQSLRDELHESFDVITRMVTPETTEADLAREIGAAQPRCIVLMGNAPMNLYQKYQRTSAGPFPPAVVVMASFFEEQRPLFRNTTGIAYEIPSITTLVNLRSFIHRPVQRVGVIYRPLFSEYIKKQRDLAAVEQVEIVAVEVSDEPGPWELRGALDKLTRRENVDAIWVLNDNVLLEPELIAKAWLKVLHKHPVAVVVGVSSLVDPRLHFGSFAMLPDHSALGLQTANLVFKLSEENWNATASPVELPISVLSVVDLPWTRQHFQFREEALERIDRVVQ